MNLNRTFCVVLAATLLTGCAGLAQRSTEPLGAEGLAARGLNLPESWQAAGAAAVPAGTEQLQAWWRSFNDPTLTALVGQALQANTTVRSAQIALQQARAQQDLSRAGNLPAVGASAGAQNTDTQGASSRDTFRAGLDASWEPDVFGARRSGQQAADADAAAAEASLGNARVSLAAEVALNLIDLRGLQLRRALAAQNLLAQQETLQITEWRVQAGLASSIDLEQARTATQQTLAQLPALDNSINQVINQLAVLTGQAPGTLQAQLAAPSLQTLPTVPQPSGQLGFSFPADTLRQRPDVRASEDRIRAALARVQQASAARYPSFSLSGSLGWGAATLGSLFDAAAFTRTLAANVSAAVFDGGAREAQLRVQEAGLAQAQTSYEAAVLAALREVEDALRALSSSRERLQRLEAAEVSASNAALLAAQRYASGLIDYRTVLDTQRSLIAVQSDLASTRAALSADHVRLYKALGGGWTPDANGN
ncbi:MAG: efflux transporter outer membrane subunit [Serpentinimonas sp.]|nr:efflux transporter outer membrane subunit [Serpentinimonas sp.]